MVLGAKGLSHASQQVCRWNGEHERFHLHGRKREWSNLPTMTECGWGTWLPTQTQLHSPNAQVGRLRCCPCLAAMLWVQDHCLVDMLHRWQNGLLPINITCVIR